MFRMKIESQLNISDRTLLAGQPGFTKIPKNITIDGDKYKVLGVSGGANLPFMSLEIERTNKQLIDKTAIA